MVAIQAFDDAIWPYVRSSGGFLDQVRIETLSSGRN